MSNTRSNIIDSNHELSKLLIDFYKNNPYGDRRYYGVTRVLSETKSEEDKASLQKWRDSVGEEKAEQILQESMSIGTALDNLIELHLNNKLNLTDHKEDIGLSLYYQIKPLIDKITPIGTQLHLYSDKYRVQGYLDCCGIYKDRITLIDFKNSRKKKDEKYVQDYFLQCTMYCILIYEMTGYLVKHLTLMIAVRGETLPQVFHADLKDYIGPAKERLNRFKEIKSKKLH